MKSQKGRSTRRFAHKSRGGCQTCKQRHTRCSQERPVCQTCRKSSRQCIYEVTLRESSSNTLKIVTWQPQQNRPRASPSATAWHGEEVSFLQHFQVVCCSHLAGSFDDSLWSRTVCQISETTAAVRHAIIALSISWRQSDMTSSQHITKLDTEKALRHYLSAVSLLPVHSKQKQGPSTYEILVCNILFFCLELCQQDYESALRQMSCCLHLFCNWQQDRIGEVLNHTSLEEMENSLSKAFKRMLAQSLLFFDTHAINLKIFEPRLGIETYIVPHQITSFDEARDCLLALISAMVHQSISQQMAASNQQGDDQKVDRPIFRLGTRQLDRFSIVFDEFCKGSTDNSSKERYQQAIVKAMLLSVRILLAEASTANLSEWAFEHGGLWCKADIDRCCDQFP